MSRAVSLRRLLPPLLLLAAPAAQAYRLHPCGRPLRAAAVSTHARHAFVVSEADADSESVQQTIEVKRPIGEVWKVITDFMAYPKWAGAISKIEVLETDGSGAPSVVKFNAGYALTSISYTLSYTSNEPTELSWVSCGGAVKKIIGKYTLEPTDDEGTEVIYDLSVDPGFALPPPLRKAVAKLIIGTALPGLKKHVERGGGA